MPFKIRCYIEYCKGEAYAGARPFQVPVSGVAKRFQDDNAKAISVHCLAHRINLSLQEVARCSKFVKEALNFAMDVTQLIKYSPKLQVVFENLQKQQEFPSLSGIRTLCPTRWPVRTGAFEAILRNYETLRTTMEISSHGSDDCSRRANGVLAPMDRLSTFLALSSLFSSLV